MGRPPVSLRLHRRATAACGALAIALSATTVLSLSVGDFPVPFTEVVRSLLGTGDVDSDLIVLTLRLPRAVTAVFVGAAFALSGAIFQSLARNPLASPDVIGVEAGASVGAVAVIVLTDDPDTVTSLGALVGGLAAALAVYLFAYRRGVTGYRLVLVGIGIGAVLSAITSYLVTRADIYDAQRALVWLTGSLNGRGWEHARPVGVALAVLVPVALWLARSLRLLEMGDDTARSLGARVGGTRLRLILVGVGLAAVATASAGPVGFVALSSPQIARRLTHTPGVALVTTALVGATVVVIADLVGRRAFAPIELPVGVITALVGAPYLLWLLARANRRGRVA